MCVCVCVIVCVGVCLYNTVYILKIWATISFAGSCVCLMSRPNRKSVMKPTVVWCACVQCVCSSLYRQEEKGGGGKGEDKSM